MLNALTEQVREELYSAYLYQALSAFCDYKGLKGFANWMDMQAQEEMIHARKIYDYIQERGELVKLDAIKAPPHEFGTPLDIMKASLEHEQYITGRINDLVDISQEEKDHASFIFLEWFVEEQVEEEASVSEIIDKLELIGDHPGALYHLDKELGTRAPPTPPQE
jgi:ferritin